jgi:hypothetical protein
MNIFPIWGRVNGVNPVFLEKTRYGHPLLKTLS